MSELVRKTLELLAETKGSFVSAVKNIFNTRTMATIKISDLSVGDWVRYKGKEYAIASIYMAGEGYTHEVALTYQGISCGCAYIDYLESIPITAEILEKNGWSTDGMYAILRIDEHLHLEYYYHEHRLRKYYSGVDEWQNHAKVTDITFATHCYSVHQLQHALMLAGVDKEINL